MPCFNCCKRFSKHTETRYQRPSQLTHRLQDKKGISGSHKLDITILGALENISDGEVSIDKLKRHSTHYLCHECHVYLRQAVNKKCELERHIGILNEKIDKISNDERRNYYKKNYGLDKNGRCWACMHEFVPSDFQRKHGQRLNMATTIVEEMTVGEAVDSLLEEQANTLIGLYQKKTYICRPCVNLLRNVIKTQCHFDTLQTSFSSLTNPNSAYAQLLAGDDVPYFEDNLIDDERVENVDDDDERLESVHHVHKTVGNLTLEVPEQRTARKRKHSSDKSDKCDVEFAEKDEGCLNEEQSESNEIVMNTENRDSGIVDNVTNDGGSEICAVNEHTDNSHCELKTSENVVSSAALDKMGDNLMALNNLQGSANMKNKMQIRLNLKGSEIEAATVLEVGSKKLKLNKDEMEIKSCKDSSIRTMSDQWKLYYYPVFAGRAEFVRLVFEEAGVPYTESTEDFAELRRLIIDGEIGGYPHFAPPMVTKGKLQVSQTPVICRYLGEQFGLYPDAAEDRLHAEQVNLCCHDYIAEGRLAFHGIYPVGSYSLQKKETQPYIDRFVAERMPQWLKYFERVIRANNEGKGFLYGDKLCYADLALFHILHATDAQFPEAFAKADYIPLLKAFKDRIAARPNIARYLKSDRWKGFCGDSMM